MSGREASAASEPAVGAIWSGHQVVSGYVEKSMRTVVQASSGEERMVAQKYGSGLANSASRREVRNKSRSFQGDIFFFDGISRPVAQALRDRASRRPSAHAGARIGPHGTECNSIVPSRLPVARSMTTSCLP